MTIAAENEKTVDYPLWPVTFTTDKFKMYPAINLGCTTIAPIGMSMTPIAFPTNDSKSEFRVDYIEMFGKSLYFIFVLDPLIESMSNFTDNNDLKNNIASTFKLIDEDGSGGLDFGEFREKIRELPTATPINLLRDGHLPLLLILLHVQLVLDVVIALRKLIWDSCRVSRF